MLTRYRPKTKNNPSQYSETKKICFVNQPGMFTMLTPAALMLCRDRLAGHPLDSLLCPVVGGMSNSPRSE
ncbi:hypothetical protein FJTKL_00673 [Diaporthe vaccinii]|uniref:Uncharacterized protein n=1 Tax=Diaporthe vaccinii TaxID=105482 RepID=A0ABR4F6R9_9PEZI